jgi:hypothetical protein
VDAKEYEKKGVVLQQCREKIESVCFDLRLRKVTDAYEMCVFTRQAPTAMTHRAGGIPAYRRQRLQHRAGGRRRGRRGVIHSAEQCRRAWSIALVCMQRRRTRDMK